MTAAPILPIPDGLTPRELTAAAFFGMSSLDRRVLHDGTVILEDDENIGLHLTIRPDFSFTVRSKENAEDDWTEPDEYGTDRFATLAMTMASFVEQDNDTMLVGIAVRCTACPAVGFPVNVPGWAPHMSPHMVLMGAGWRSFAGETVCPTCYSSKSGVPVEDLLFRFPCGDVQTFNLEEVK